MDRCCNASKKPPNFEGALLALNDAIGVAHRAEYFVYRAHVLLQLNKAQDAVRDCNAAIEIDPSNSNALKLRFDVLADCVLKLTPASEARKSHADPYWKDFRRCGRYSSERATTAHKLRRHGCACPPGIRPTLIRRLLDDVYQRAKAILSTLVALRGQMIHLDVITRLSRPREEAKRIEGELASGLARIARTR